MVLDDLSDPADLEGLWPAGPAGKVLITTTDATSLSADRRELVFPCGRLQPSRGAQLPDRPPDRGYRSAPGRHRPRRGPGLRATGARPGQRGHREFRPVLPGLPGFLRPPPGFAGRGRRRRAACRRDHLDLLVRASRTAVTRRCGPGAAGTVRAARRARDPRCAVHHAGGLWLRRGQTGPRAPWTRPVPWARCSSWNGPACCPSTTRAPRRRSGWSGWCSQRSARRCRR